MPFSYSRSVGSTVAIAAFALATALPLVAQTQHPYKVEAQWKTGGDGGWDYLTVDAAAHRLYIAHSAQVEAIDLNSGKVAGTVKGVSHTHGVVIAQDGKTGFVSDGGTNEVVAFDPQTFAVLARVPAGKNPDGIAYDSGTGTVWAFNGGSNDATEVSATERKSLGTVALPGRPEFPVADGHGTIYANIESKNEIVRIDVKSQKITATWPLAGCESPSGLALDEAGMRLFSVCDGGKMAVTDARTGKSLATPAIGKGPDADRYDAKNKLAISSNGEGTMTFIDASKPNYPVLQTLATARGARTMALDESTGKIYTVSAQSGPPKAGQRWPSPLPGTFTVYVIGRE
jgi:DNA-binding beta-propeller fold protein YncE